MALGYVGLVEVPGTGAKGQGVLKDPRVLGEKDGLPARPVTAIAGEAQRMWVAFGDPSDRERPGPVQRPNGRVEDAPQQQGQGRRAAVIRQTVP